MKHPTVTRLLCTLLALCLLCGGLFACSKESEIPEGYQYATCNGEYFLLFVPTQWTVNTESGISGGSYSLLEGTAVSMTEDGNHGIPVPDYTEELVSTKVVKIIQSYTGVVDKMVWRKF